MMNGDFFYIYNVIKKRNKVYHNLVILYKIVLQVFNINEQVV